MIYTWIGIRYVVALTGYPIHPSGYNILMFGLIVPIPQKCISKSTATETSGEISIPTVPKASSESFTRDICIVGEIKTPLCLPADYSLWYAVRVLGERETPWTSMVHGRSWYLANPAKSIMTSIRACVVWGWYITVCIHLVMPWLFVNGFNLERK